MPSISGTVEAISSKERNTKNGLKKVYSIKLGTDWFNTGFKDPKVSKGDQVTFDYSVGTYGNDLDVKTLKTLGKAAEAPVSVPKGLGGPKGSFPIGPLDGQRSIVRQNALTNARELYALYLPNVAMDEPRCDLEKAANAIIKTAKIFEAYTTGDMDMAEAIKEVNEDS